jgi:hypothetical protein
LDPEGVFRRSSNFPSSRQSDGNPHRPSDPVADLKSLDFLAIVSSASARRNNSPPRRNHFLLWRRHPETANGYQGGNETADSAGSQTRRQSMKTLSFVLAFAFLLVGPSMAGSSDNGLPGIGTFAYNGSPIGTSAPQAIVVATR